MIRYIFQNSYFSFDNSCLKQLVKTAMGKPLSPLLANLFKDDFIDKKGVNFDIPILNVNVDNTIAVIPNNKNDMILNTFNSYQCYLSP